MRGRSIWQRENPSAFVFDRPWKWICLPGVAVQWVLYMFPSGRFARVVSDTRVSHSELMTYALTVIFYLALLAFFVMLARGG